MLKLKIKENAYKFITSNFGYQNELDKYKKIIEEVFNKNYFVFKIKLGTFSRN